jgi:hypothetical protein
MAEKLQPHSQKKHWRSLWPSAACRGAFLYPVAVKPGCRQPYKRDLGMTAIQWGMCYIHQQKIPRYCLTAFSGGFKYETTVVR